MAGRIRHLFLLCLTACLVAAPGSVCASPALMKAPPGRSSSLLNEPAATGRESRLLLEAIRFFQKYISPTDGARCQFSPTCSTFGHQAIHRHGEWLGLLMTTDRLMRCSYWTDPAAYPKRTDGRLADPVVTRPGSN